MTADPPVRPTGQGTFDKVINVNGVPKRFGELTGRDIEWLITHGKLDDLRAVVSKNDQ